MIQKNKYDVDIFLRFDKKFKDDEISHLTEKLLKNFKFVESVHGSREYFRIKITPNFFIEVVPVTKVSNPEQSRNITDLSYSHVRYIRKKIKNKKIFEEIRFAKAFCYAHHCYGAESYISGFSGYALELLVYHYGSFEKFIRAIAKLKDKEIIDIEKDFKNKRHIMLDLNSSKLESPIILIDPTYKHRNTLAALSEETLKKFQKVCKEFIKNPSLNFFEEQKTDLDKMQKQAEKNKYQFVLLQSKTDKQEGDIAGTKLLKFYKHFSCEIGKFFEIKDSGFNYNQNQSARYFFVAQVKKEILCQGPFVKDEKNVKAFKKEHKSYFTKKGKIYAKEKAPKDLANFILTWKKKNSKRLKEMYILDLKII